jgi:hypothetical protein
LGAAINNLGEGVTDFALGGALIISDLVVASDHFLCALDDFVLEDVKTLLELI